MSRSTIGTPFSRKINSSARFRASLPSPGAPSTPQTETPRTPCASATVGFSIGTSAVVTPRAIRSSCGIVGFWAWPRGIASRRFIMRTSPPSGGTRNQAICTSSSWGERGVRLASPRNKNAPRWPISTAAGISSSRKRWAIAARKGPDRAEGRPEISRMDTPCVSLGSIATAAPFSWADGWKGWGKGWHAAKSASTPRARKRYMRQSRAAGRWQKIGRDRAWLRRFTGPRQSPRSGGHNQRARRHWPKSRADS